MATAETSINESEERLQDPSNKIWVRAELLDYLNEGQKDMAVRSAMLATFAAFNSPGRWGYAASHLWEIEEVRPARAWLPFLRYADNRYRTMYKWELEELDKRTPTNSGTCITQPWEIAHAATDRPLPFPLPDRHIRTIRAAWDFRRIGGTTVKEMDALEYDWWENTATLPQWFWADTLGTKQFGIFPLHAGYIQGYDLTGTDPNGTPREFSGDRTYSFSSFEPAFRAMNGHTTDADGFNATPPSWRFTRKSSDAATTYVTQKWEEDQVEGTTPLRTGENVGIYFWEHTDHDHADNFPASFILGVPRSYAGRDYIVEDPAFGSPRNWQSAADALGMVYARIPTPIEIEAESPNEIHPRLHKYLRFYQVSKALSRQGPGRNSKLAAYYERRYEMGLALFKVMAMMINRDVEFRREKVVATDRRPPRVQFPPEFERVLR